MTQIDIISNEIQNFSVEQYAFETILKFFGTAEQIKNIKSKPGLTIGTNLKIVLKTVDGDEIDTAEGTCYMLNSGCQALYGTTQLNFQVALRKI